MLFATLHAQHPPPDWAQDAIWYQIFPERFRNGDSGNDPTRSSLEHPHWVPDSWQISKWTGDWFARDDWERQASPDFYGPVFQRRYGGDIQGIIDKLDYLQELGVNALYLNPVFYADSMHKYDGNLFHHIDPHFGPDPEGDLALMANASEDPQTWPWTAADRLFLKLIREARARGMRIIIDGVWNHTGRNFFAFRDLQKKQQQSRYRDWYQITSWDDPKTGSGFDYKGWNGFKSLPVFAHSEDGTNLASGPREYIFAVTRRWMDPLGNGDTSYGVDGWRLDVAEEVPDGFWREWHALVREINPNAYTTAEIWTPAGDFLSRTHFNAAMNYAGFAIPVKGWLVDQAIDAGEFAERLAQERRSYSPQQFRAMQNLVDSHDTQRITSAIANRADGPAQYHHPHIFDFDERQVVRPRYNRRYNIRAPDEAGRRIWKMVTLLQVTYPGAPMLYYGTEAGMWGPDDPDNRMPMVWDDMQYEPIAHTPWGHILSPSEQVEFNWESFMFHQLALLLRQDFEALRRGDFRQEVAEGQVFAFSRNLPGHDGLYVILNRDPDNPYVSPHLRPGAQPILETAPDTSGSHIPPLSAAVFRLP